jgi:hypothetical protein
VEPVIPWMPVAPVTPCAPVEPVGPWIPVGPVIPWMPCAPVMPCKPVAPVGPAGPSRTKSSAAEWLVVTLSLLSRKKAADDGTPSKTNPKFVEGLASQPRTTEVTSSETNCAAAGTVTEPTTAPAPGWLPKVTVDSVQAAAAWETWREPAEPIWPTHKTRFTFAPGDASTAAGRLDKSKPM